MRIVVLGGGYGGLRLIERLAKTDGVELTLVDQHPYHYMQTEVYGYIAGANDLDDIAIDLASWAQGFDKTVRYIQGRVTAVDPAAKRVRLENGTALLYDRLVVATGARTRFPDFIEGLRRHSFGVKQLSRAFGFRHRFEAVVEAKIEGDGAPVNLVVAGAGLSGVEVAAEMANALRRYEKSLGERARRVTVTLVDACETILPGLHPAIVKASRKRLEALGVRILTGAFIDRVEEAAIHFKEGDPLSYTFLIFSGGIEANTGFLPETFARNPQGQLEVDPYLRLPGHDDIYAIGDAAFLKDPANKPLPPTAQTAERSAEHVARAIAAELAGRPLPRFKGRMDGFFVALGGRYGAAELFGWHFAGLGAYWMKRAVTFIYWLGIRLRANAGYRIRR
ncbi:NAD(P)/FAD-dependent oxidoreductase [Hydrogenimonas sp.]